MAEFSANRIADDERSQGHEHNESAELIKARQDSSPAQFARKHWKAGMLATIALATAMVVGTAGSSLAASQHSVKLNVDGIIQPVSGWMTTVDDVLKAANVPVSRHDVVVPQRGTQISDNQTITVRHSRQVWVKKDGAMKHMWVSGQSLIETVQALQLLDAKAQLVVNRIGDFELPIAFDDVTATVTSADSTSLAEGDASQENKNDADAKDYAKDESSEGDSSNSHTFTVRQGMGIEKALKQNGIELDALDQISAHFVEPGHIALTVDTTSREIVTEEKEVDFSTEEEKTDELYEGEKEVVTKGEKGIDTYSYAVVKQNGSEAKRELIAKERTKEPVTEKVKIGTKKLPASGGGSGSKSFTIPKAPANPSAAQLYARSQLASFGFADSEFGCLVSLWNRESGWNYKAQNSSSGAYGIPQSLPGSKMASAGSDWRTNPQTQIRWGLGYIKGRYGTPCGAWRFFTAHNYY